jgi:hypothetical protein
MNVRDWLIRLYPRAWRERYGDEFDALLEESLHSPLDVLDIFLGALDAHLELSHATNWRLMNMTNKLRTAVLIVFAAYITFVVAGFSLAAFADDSPFVPLMEGNAALSVAWTTIQVGSVISLLAVVIGGAPLAWTVIRRSLTSQRKDLRLLMIPLYAFFAFVLYTAFMIAVAFEIIPIPGFQPVVQNGILPPVNRVLMSGEILVFVLGAVVSTIAVWKVISRTDVEQDTLPLPGKPTVKLYEFAFGPAVIATIAMLVMFVAALVWGWLAFTARPDLLSGNLGPMMTSTLGSFSFSLVLMAIAAGAACFGIVRGRSSRKAV